MRLEQQFSNVSFLAGLGDGKGDSLVDLLGRREGGAQQTTTYRGLVSSCCNICNTCLGCGEDFGTAHDVGWNQNMLTPSRLLVYPQTFPPSRKIHKHELITTPGFVSYCEDGIKMTMTSWINSARRSLATSTILLSLIICKTTALSQQYCSSQNTGADSAPGMRTNLRRKYTRKA